MSDTKVQRQSNFELLRIFAMFAIVIYHLIGNGVERLNSSIFVNNVWGYYLHSLGQTGVWIFMLITGYFLCDSKKFNFLKLVKFCLQCFTYSVGVYLVYYIYKKPNVDQQTIIKKILPITSGQWWFASAYFLVYIFSPFYNKFLKILSRAQFKFFLFIGGFFWIFLPTFIGSRISFYANGFCILMYIYAVGAYLKKYALEYNIKKGTYLLIALLISLFALGLYYLYLKLKIENNFLFHGIVWDITHTHSIYVMFMAIFVFLFFMKLNIGYIKVINFCSQATFGVYLLHTAGTIMDLWVRMFKGDFLNKPYFIPYTIGFALAIYVACTIVELIRIYAVESIYMKLVNKVLPVVKKAMLNLYNKVARF